MNDNFLEYEQMRDQGVDVNIVCLYSRLNGLDPFAQIRMIRNVFGLSLVEAKQVTVTSSGQSSSLSDHQKKLFPVLKEALDDLSQVGPASPDTTRIDRRM